MMPNRKATVLIFIANSLYIVYFIMLMVWLKQPLITDIFKQPPVLANDVLVVIQIVMALLSLIVFAGLTWLLNSYKEKFWIVLSVGMYMILELYFNALSVLNISRMPLPSMFLSYTIYVNYAVLLYMVVSLQFVQNKLIKGYYRWLGILILLSLIWVRISPVLYDRYDLRWALINPGVVKIIPFIISLFLFLKILKVSKPRRA